MTETRRTFEDELRDAGKSAEGLFACPAHCGRSVRAFEIVATPEFSKLPDMACSNCVVEATRVAQATEEKEATAALAPWECEQGIYVKTLRNARLDSSLWAILPDSPLTAECQAAFIAYRQALHRITLDFSNPEDVVWPEPPSLEYGASDADA